LDEFFGIKNIPSHDTIREIFERTDPNAFVSFLNAFTEELKENVNNDIISIDGKTIRNSGAKPLHIMSAWSSKNSLVIAHSKTKGKGTEIQGFKDIIDLLDIENHIVTMDAMGCQKDITKKIVEKGGEFVVSIKDNQKNLKKDIEAYFLDEMKESYEVIDKKRGVVEHTVTRGTSEINDLLTQYPEWNHIKSIYHVKTVRTTLLKETVQDRFVISSIPCNPKKLWDSLTAHWEIENKVHWYLDVRFYEDKACIRNVNNAENMNIMRKFALNTSYKIQSLMSEKITMKNIQKRFSKPKKTIEMLKFLFKFDHA
jgi:predicted transposase YbfD/YdcC